MFQKILQKIIFKFFQAWNLFGNLSKNFFSNSLTDWNKIIQEFILKLSLRDCLGNSSGTSSEMLIDVYSKIPPGISWEDSSKNSQEKLLDFSRTLDENLYHIFNARFAASVTSEAPSIFFFLGKELNASENA